MPIQTEVPSPAGSGGDQPSPAGSGGDQPSPAGSGGDQPSPAGERRATLIQTRTEWRRALDERRARGERVGLVPTMGSLHAGHLSLIRKAAAHCDVVTVTIYVNPLQFGPDEDLAVYPRDLQHDLALAAEAGADLVFAPTTHEMFPEPPTTAVRVSGVADRLEGAARPGHFDGVATIVAKLFALAGPCIAYFGEKDFQQLAVVRRLVTDLSLPVDLVGCPTVRESDGLALSSRNAYLTPEERRVAPTLYAALLAGKRAVEEDRMADPAEVEAAVARVITDEPRLTLDYAAVVDPADFARPTTIAGPVRLLVAAKLGRARLIDNLATEPPAS